MSFILHWDHVPIVVEEPLLGDGVLAKGRVVTPAQATIMITHGIQAIGRPLFSLSSQFLTIVGHLEIFDRKINCFRNFSTSLI